MSVDTGPKAIQTRFDGHHFRSRLEARWAVFLKALGIEYEYEKEGYELGGGVRYLPDFWLPQADLWLEVKGEQIEEGDTAWVKAQRLAELTGHRVAVFSGSFRQANWDSVALLFRTDPGHPVEPSKWWKCSECGGWDVAPDIGGVWCACYAFSPARRTALEQACIRAQEARFEHGEQG